MAQMVGADVAQLRHLASELGRAANELNAIEGSLTAGVGSTPWRGASGDQFRSEWHLSHRYRLASCRVFLAEAQQLLLQQAEQQASASTAEAASTSGWKNTWWGAVVGPIGTVAGTAATSMAAVANGTPVKWLGAAVSVSGVADLLSRNASITGRYTNAWNQVRGLPGMDYKSSSWLQRLHSPALKPLAGLANSTPAEAFEKVGLVYNTVTNAHDAVSGFMNGDLAQGGEGLLDTAAGLLKANRTNPVLYLAGVNVSIWTDVAKESGNFVEAIKSGESVPWPTSKDVLRDVYWPTAVDVGKELKDRVFGWL